MRRRFLSVLLSLCLVLGLLPTEAFAQDTIQYVALGDSITAGYRLADDEKAFPEIIAEDNGYVLTNLANSGDTSGDLLEVVQDPANAGDLASADLITITIGGNDLMGALYQFLADKYNEGKDESNQIDAQRVQIALVDEEDEIHSTVLLTALFNISDFAASNQADDALDTVADSLGDVIEKITSMNSDACVIVANQYNPYSHIEGTNAAAIVNAFEAGIKALNEVIASGAGVGYQVADVYAAFEDADENPCNAYFASTSDMNLDFHPNAYGHELMAGVISELLSESEEPGTEEPGGEEQPEPLVDSLYVNGENILEARDYTVQCGSGEASSDAATNTLTLTNATITNAKPTTESSKIRVGIYAVGDLTM